MFRKFVEKSFLIIPVIAVLVIVSWHLWYGSRHPLAFDRRESVMTRKYVDRLEQAEKLITLSPEELDAIRRQAEEALAQRMSPEELAAFPTAQEIAGEMIARYGAVDREAWATFIVGTSHLAMDEPHHAIRLFRSSFGRTSTRSAHLAIGYTLKILGEDLASYDVYAALKEEAAREADNTLLRRAYRLADPSTGQHNTMMGVGILVGAVFSFFMASAIFAVWIRSLRRTRMGIKPNEWPSMRRALYLRRFRAAAGQGALDLLEREVVPLIDRRIDGFGGDDRPVPLAIVRKEAEGSGVEPQAELAGEKEYLSALFLDAIGAHGEAQRHYGAALRKLDLPAIYLAQGVSLTYLKRKGAARKAYQQAVRKGEVMGEAAAATVARAAGYLSRR